MPVAAVVPVLLVGAYHTGTIIEGLALLCGIVGCGIVGKTKEPYWNKQQLGFQGEWGGGGVLMSGMAVVVYTNVTIDPRASLYHVGTEHVGFSPTRQTSIACTERKAP